MAKRDYYDILGIPRTANEDEIKRAHRKLVRQHHPDVNKNNAESTEKFKEAQEAYDVLSDATKRRNYDQFGHAGVNAGAGPAGGTGDDPFEAFRQSRSRGGRQWRSGDPNVTVEDMEAGGFSDIFEQLFGGGTGAGRSSGPRPGSRPRQRPMPRGSDVEHAVTLTFAQAARGTSLPLQINREGRLETIEVKIPPGVKDGSRIRIKGRGMQSGGEPGDLYIVTKVHPHPYFRREELDIYIDVPISLYEAVLGTKIDVPTLDGPITLTIPPGSSSGAKLRIRSRGVERGGERGDQFVMIRVMVPKDLTEEDRDAIRRMSEQHPMNARADSGW